MTGEHRPTASRITDALLRAPEATDLPAVETTTRLRPISPTDPPPPGPTPTTRSTPPAPAPSAAQPVPAAPAQPAAQYVPATAAPAQPASEPVAAAPAPTLPAAPAQPAAQPVPAAPHPSTAMPSAPPRPAAAPAGRPGGPARPATTVPGATAVPPRPTTAPAGATNAPADAPRRPTAAPAWPAAGPREPAGRPVRPAAGAAGPAAPVRPAAASAGTRPEAAPARAMGAPAVAGAVRSRSLPPYGQSYGPGALPPEAPVEVTTRLRPVRERRTGRTLATALCAVLGFGLIGGALAGVWLAAAEPGKPVEPVGYTEAKDLWHNAPVDTLFPRTLAGPGAGPGGAARTWTRIVVAPDAPCTSAVLAKGLLATVRPLGCERVLRATYTDATTSSVITVGLVFTRADAATQRTLGQDLTTRLGADVPPALAGPGTVAERFGAPQRAGWWLNAPADLPVVVTAVSGFADGRTVDGGPVPADRAMTANRTDATAQSGLGHEAKGITERLVRLLRTAATSAAKENAR
ncbi:hypothetical protein ACFZCG_26620 [Streptomyces tanashiensis]|uniref:hypothetical protein n=1 Tax=Streptomyces tanashiensis TaxID=67367 RepID=UPI0036E940F3